MFMTRDKIFNYFASFQHISESGGNLKPQLKWIKFNLSGKRDMMMTPKDFYASITPDCAISGVTNSPMEFLMMEVTLMILTQFPTIR